MIEDEIGRAKSTKYHLVHPKPSTAAYYTTLYRNCRFSDHLLAKWVMGGGSTGDHFRHLIPPRFVPIDHSPNGKKKNNSQQKIARPFSSGAVKDVRREEIHETLRGSEKYLESVIMADTTSSPVVQAVVQSRPLSSSSHNRRLGGQSINPVMMSNSFGNRTSSSPLSDPLDNVVNFLSDPQDNVVNFHPRSNFNFPGDKGGKRGSAGHVNSCRIDIATIRSKEFVDNLLLSGLGQKELFDDNDNPMVRRTRPPMAMSPRKLYQATDGVLDILRGFETSRGVDMRGCPITSEFSDTIGNNDKLHKVPSSTSRRGKGRSRSTPASARQLLPSVGR